ncbi:tripartite tricarboxylate transporter substrate binding protein [Cupriavidus sp. CV2]|uniref:Bug family tripartite tricarboxylate transporter substrate binding protein n=1 Tax=Cupriavidus ulmosensis TaxID=3065913 RepID=UPI00296B3383|nr:tripartite tricarboxylate transporter substrate binding protein [Cupriavidus sp. CV2]MDW3682801.1 tripartite tricarboxylate transporter substrate binding protein [Cupriavidus sp. CV2]
MKRPTLKALALFGIALGISSASLAADPFPTRPIRIVVNTAPGGLLDFTIRLVAKEMGANLKQSVIIENRAGGDGLIGINVAKSAPADGYTLLGSAGTMAFQQVIREDPGYDLTRDFTGVGFVGRSPFLVVVSPEQPDKTLKDFVARAKSHPNALSYGSAGVGTAPHFAAALFNQKAGLQLLHVPYKGNGPAMPDVMSGRVNMIFDAYSSSRGYLTAGKLKALAVSSTARISALPNVPTLAEEGVSGYSYYTWMGLVAPAGTPKEVVQRLSEALKSALSNKALAERLNGEGIETPYMATAEFNEFLAKEVSQTRRLVTDLKLPKQ